MALIKCSECGHDISDKANACIHCGCPVEKKITCSECGNIISGATSVCLYCGCPVRIETKYNDVNNNEKMDTFILIGFIVSLISLFLDFYGLVAISGIVLSVIGYNNMNNKKTQKGKGLAIAGIAIGGVEAILKFVQLITLYIV